MIAGQTAVASTDAVSDAVETTAGVMAAVAYLLGATAPESHPAVTYFVPRSRWPLPPAPTPEDAASASCCVCCYARRPGTACAPFRLHVWLPMLTHLRPLAGDALPSMSVVFSSGDAPPRAPTAFVHL